MKKIILIIVVAIVIVVIFSKYLFERKNNLVLQEGNTIYNNNDWNFAFQHPKEWNTEESSCDNYKEFCDNKVNFFITNSKKLGEVSDNKSIKTSISYYKDKKNFDSLKQKIIPDFKDYQNLKVEESDIYSYGTSTIKGIDTKFITLRGTASTTLYFIPVKKQDGIIVFSFDSQTQKEYPELLTWVNIF